MRVLLDEHLPLDFAKELVGHEASTVRAQGWSGLKNGELLRAAASAGFEVLLTNDRGIEHQQSLAGLTLSVVVLNSPSNKLHDLRARLAATLEAIGVAQPGGYHHLAR